MKRQYAYFRAMGRSLEAIEALEAGQEGALGQLLGAPEMPMIKSNSGRHQKSFVFLEINDDPPLQDMPNPICHAKMNGYWYIRVPCDENNEPRFLPPDSPERDYGQILSGEFIARGGHRKGPRPVPRF